MKSAGFSSVVWHIPPNSAPSDDTFFRTHSIVPHFSHGPARFWDIHRSFSRALRQAEITTTHVVHASDLYTLPAARAASRRTGAALTFDARELYPYVSATVGRPWVSRFWTFVESRIVPECDAVFTVNHSIADVISKRYRVPRPTVVENIPPYRESRETDVIRRRLGLADRVPVVLHQGHIRKDRGCAVLVRAAAQVPDTNLVFLGEGPLRDHARQLACDLEIAHRVHFLNPVRPDQLLDFTASATLGVTLLEDTCLNHHLALPNKLFEYLMAGIPVLASDLPEIRKIVAEFDVGRLAQPGDVAATADVLHHMINDPHLLQTCRLNTRRVFETINWESASERFVSVFQRLLES